MNASDITPAEHDEDQPETNGYAYMSTNTDTQHRSHEDPINKHFFDKHPNIGIVDDKDWDNRDALQCPVQPLHKITFRRLIHIEQCVRANGGRELEVCIYNQFHRFYKEDRDEHYRLCCAWLLIQARYRLCYPDYKKYKSYLQYKTEPWSYDAYVRQCADLGRPVDEINQEQAYEWWHRQYFGGKYGNHHVLPVTKELLTDLSKAVIKEGEDLEKEEATWGRKKLPNFYNRRPPRLILPPLAPPAPQKPKRDKSIKLHREVFDMEKWWATPVEYRGPVVQKLWGNSRFPDEMKPDKEEANLEEECGVGQLWD